MFKKVMIASALIASSSGIAFSACCTPGAPGYTPPCPTCATYFFIPAPYLGLSVGFRDNFARTPIFYQGFEGTISLGYGGLVCGRFFYNPMNLYLAAELFGGASAQIVDYKNDGRGAKSTWSYGFDILPGIQLTDPVIGYLRFGVVRTRFSDQGGNATGWRAGIGFLTNLYPNWDMRAEYIYTWYGSVHNTFGNPKSDIFNIGLIYKFC